MNERTTELLKNILKRTISAFFLLAVVISCVQFLGSFGFFLFIQIVILASLFEFYNLARRRNLLPRIILGILLSLIVALSFYIEAFTLHHALLISLFITSVYFVISIRTIEAIVRFPSDVALTLFGPLYLSLTLNFFFWIRQDWGANHIYFLLSVIIIGDTGSFLIGKTIGKHKFLPMVSPKKTWEGCFGGVIFAGLGGIAAQQIFLPADALLWKVLIFSLLINIACQLGDPFESLFKRAAGVKDSSQVIPGHGGFLDRADSLVFTAPLFFYLLMFLGLN